MTDMRHRLELQSDVRRAVRDFRAEDQQGIELKRTQLTHSLAVLDDLQKKAFPGVHPVPAALNHDTSAFDSLEHDIADGSIDNLIDLDTQDPSAVAPKCAPLVLPSRGSIMSHAATIAEQKGCIRQAEKHLSNLRNAIADKSFQYSHVICVSPRQGVRTRARGRIANINAKIATHCRAYSRARTALVKLQAPDEILNVFLEL